MRIGGNKIKRLPDEIMGAPLDSQLSLPQFFEESAQSPALQAWLANPVRRRRHPR